jgi:hypothetical protein
MYTYLSHVDFFFCFEKVQMDCAQTANNAMLIICNTVASVV